MAWWSILKNLASSEEKSAGDQAEAEPVTEPVVANIDIPEVSPQDPASSAPSTRPYTGRVKWFNEKKGFGYIEVDSPQGHEVKPDVWVHLNNVESEPFRRTRLFRGEPVEFNIAYSEDGRSRAEGVICLEPRMRGRVASWRYDERFGFIEADGFNSHIFAHYTDIMAEGPRELYDGEEVEFFVRNEDGKFQAFYIQVFSSRFPLERFANIYRVRNGQLLKKLKELAQDEDWDYHNAKADQEHPVLESYIIYTFARLLEEEKIAYAATSDGKKIACANTGLATQLQEEIFAYFTENSTKGENAPKWLLNDFVRESDMRLRFFGKRPDIASYYDDPTELIYNLKRNLVVDKEHIVRDHWKRFPVEMHKNEFLRRQHLDSAIEVTKQRVRRNYKTAIPQYYQKKIQLLLPLCLSDPAVADLALVIRHEGEVYIGRTVLPLEAAYNNARLIARPDREWLQP